MRQVHTHPEAKNPRGELQSMLGGPAGSAAGGTGCGEERERRGSRVMTRAAERPSSRGGGEPGLEPQMGGGGA